MSIREVKRRRLKKYSIGDMRERITLYPREITAPTYSTTSPTELYENGLEVWASVETLERKKEIFDDVNVSETASHSFTIRFNSTKYGFPLQLPLTFTTFTFGITSEYMVIWEGKIYEILKTSHPDGRKEYVELLSRLQGKQTLAANT